MSVAHQKEKGRATDQHSNDRIVKRDNNFFRKFLGASIYVKIGEKTGNEPGQCNYERAQENPTLRYFNHRRLVEQISHAKSDENSEQVRYVLGLYIQQMGTAQFHACKSTASAAILPISFADLTHVNE